MANLFAISFGIGCLLISFVKLRVAVKTKSWPSVRGFLVAVEQQGDHSIPRGKYGVFIWHKSMKLNTYEYIVQDRVYQFKSPANLDDLPNPLFFYDPDNPSNVTLTPGIKAKHIVNILFSLGVILTGFFIDHN